MNPSIWLPDWQPYVETLDSKRIFFILEQLLSFSFLKEKKKSR